MQPGTITGLIGPNGAGKSTLMKAVFGLLLGAIADDLPSRASYLRWLFVALLLAGIVLFRPQGILLEEKVVSRYAFDRRRSQSGS